MWQTTRADIEAMDLTPQDFRPIRTLGRGDIGTVFLVASRSDDRPYAMKMMSKEELRKKGVRRAETEKRVLSLLDHPFLPTLRAHFESEEHIFFVIDYCPGQDLNVLRQRQPLQRFSVADTRFYAAEVILALEHLHKLQIIYRDLKPENILIQASGHLMVTDFDLSLIVEAPIIDSEKSGKGLGSLKNLFSCINSDPQCRRKQGIKGKPGLVCVSGRKQEILNLDASQAKGNNGSKVKVASRVWPVEPKPRKSTFSTCRSHSLVGTEEYVAPEVLWGNGHGFSVDWWTLGILLYEMVYGRTPFKGSNRKETFFNILSKEPKLPEISSPVNDLIKKLLVKEPDMRLGSLYGAEEIKNHQFFHGLAWKHLKDVTSPPFIPARFVLRDSGKDQVQKHGFQEDGRSSQKQSRSNQKNEEVQIQSTSDHHSKDVHVQKSMLQRIALKSKDSRSQHLQNFPSNKSNNRTTDAVKEVEVKCNSSVEKIPSSQPKDPVLDQGDSIVSNRYLHPFRDSNMPNAAKEVTLICGRSGTEELFSVF